uniref:Methyltranfer_dom domain-containing protein n=1 Tax=Panagrellus redivivus TaxID=6233 RepID=A0A7E5A2C7_PANRE
MVIMLFVCYQRNNKSLKFSIDSRTIYHFQEKANLRRQKLDGSAREFYNALATEAICPNLFRVGRIGDGGKWMCGPQFVADWENDCVIYSFGISGDTSFEREIHGITNGKCDMVAVDLKHVEEAVRELKKIGADYVETKVNNFTARDTMTIADLMKRFDHTHIDILKMDVEGSEYDIADHLFQLEICQIMVELHTKDREYEKIVDWLKKASAVGYYLIHHEVNFMYMNCVEVTLLHSNCFSRFGDIIPLTSFLH